MRHNSPTSSEILVERLNLIASIKSGSQSTISTLSLSLHSLVPFEVSPHGVIRTKDSLDRETQPSYEFHLYVRDEGHPPMTSSAVVTVRVNDVNDHAPVFVHGPYEGTVVEDDADPNPRQLVKLVGGKHKSKMADCLALSEFIMLNRLN